MNYKYDVVIAGAGPAGIAAALEASRTGSKVALIERYGIVGGNLTSGYVGPVLGSVCKGTIASEIRERVCPQNSDCPDFEKAKYELAVMLYEENIDVFLQTLVTGAKVTDGVIEYIEAFGKSGKMLFEADIFIDATGDGDLAVAGGCEYKIGRESDALVQPISIMFTITGIDPEQKLFCRHEEDYTILSDGREYLDLCHKSSKNGVLPENVNIVRLYSTGNPTERMVNATQRNRVNPLDPKELFASEVDVRGQIMQITRFLRSEVPGFENITVKSSASTMGVRESRRIIGDYVLTADDLMNGREYPDSIVHRAHFSLDIHNPDGAGQSVSEVACPPTPKPYDIPYRAIIPVEIQNMLIAGRCISGTHEAMSSYRVMTIAMAIGQAAGAAASLASSRSIRPRMLDAGLIREHLIMRGVEL